MESEQRRKRKRSYRPNSRSHFFFSKVVNGMLIFLGFAFVLVFLSVSNSGSSLPPASQRFELLNLVEDFPSGFSSCKIYQADKLDCVYYTVLNDSVEVSEESKDKVFIHHGVLSVDEYDAAVDGETAVVFVKGLNLRPHRVSNPTQFRCRFGLGNTGKDEGFVLMTKAVAAAQEVVRCSLPTSIRNNPYKAQGIRVSLVHADRGGRSELNPMPSVAKLYNSNSYMKKKKRGKYELCACTMLWNQSWALREWITYHAWLGVERWFIYDNNSDDGTQQAGFSHCALRARNECKWVGFFDVDEFYYFPLHHRRGLLGPNLLRFLVANYSSSTTIAEIRTVCHSFGPSGLSSPPSLGVTVGYTCRLQNPERHKSIVRPDLLNETLFNVVHHFQLRKGFRYLNVHEGSMIINHYKYQLWDTFRTKFFRRVATYVVDWQENQNQGSKDRVPGLGIEAIEPPNWRLQFCEVWDTGLRDFVLANLADPATALYRHLFTGICCKRLWHSHRDDLMESMLLTQDTKTSDDYVSIGGGSKNVIVQGVTCAE
ncbi:UPF0392 protein [Hibiscus syriacus]|uniref:Glycosyltransferase family 92 protein n=1 Tax=Hibiscus syriacus TaxID=106335 RepID=A0A6A3A705_HIBSY|nr:UPF0392 protein [Hibiscus syriacus]